MSHGRLEQLIKMINQIARNNPCNGDDNASAEVVLSHVRKFWAKPMKQDIIAHLEQGGEGLDPVATEAVRSLQATQNTESS